VLIDCEGGYFAGDATGGAMYDRQGKKFRTSSTTTGGGRLEVPHLTNFVSVMRSRKSAELACEAWEGHCSAAAAHLVNISHRLGREAKPESIRELIQGRPELTDAFSRSRPA
jgi:hypothetical protein